jgi:hypothetical protein
MKRSRLAALLALIALNVLAVAACSPFPSHHVATQIGPLPSSGGPAVVTPGSLAVPPPATTDGSGDVRATPGPDVVRFGAHDGMLFLEVVNRSTASIKAARVLITARGAAGDTIVSATGRLGSRCCTIYGLPPGGRYGLFVSLRGSTEPVASVEVSYIDRSVSVSRRKTPAVALRHPVLRISHGDAVVRATLITRRHTGAYVVGQAFLTDRRGRLVGVISGRFYCFAPNSAKTVFMHLLHPVPKGTRIAGTAAYSVPHGEPTGVSYRCRS